MPSVREMLQNQKTNAQRNRNNNLNLPRKEVKKTNVFHEHFISKERRVHNKQFFRMIYCGWMDGIILPQTNEEGCYVMEDYASELYTDPELIHLNKYQCNTEEIKNILNYVIENLDKLAKVIKNAPGLPIPEIHLDCRIEVNFSSNPTECYISCLFLFDNLPIENSGQVKNIRSCNAGTFTIKNNIVEFSHF